MTPLVYQVGDQSCRCGCRHCSVMLQELLRGFEETKITGVLPGDGVKVLDQVCMRFLYEVSEAGGGRRGDR